MLVGFHIFANGPKTEVSAPLNKTCQRDLGQLLCVIQVDHKIADAPVSRRYRKVLSFQKYQLLNKFWAFQGGLISITIWTDLHKKTSMQPLKDKMSSGFKSATKIAGPISISIPFC